jgi:hypothetical protein
MMFKNLSLQANSQPIGAPRRENRLQKYELANSQPLRLNLSKDNSKNSKLDLKA